MSQTDAIISIVTALQQLEEDGKITSEDYQEFLSNLSILANNK